MSSVGQALGGIVGGVAGFFLGGPMGALRGAQLGIMAGGIIDPPKGPNIVGPRLEDLSVQTSTYGAVIPRVYGTVSVVGNVIWLKGDKLTERKKKTSSGGKGGPSQTTTTFSYFATFAVGLCKGPIAGIRRIWVGPNLYYDAGADDMESIIASNRSADMFTLYLGTGTQNPNPDIQADKGVPNTSAYRGLAYIVFDDLPLEKYGNSLMGAQVKVEVIKSGTWSQGSTVFGILTGSGPRIPEAGATAANEYPSASYPYGSVSKTYSGDISGRSWSLIGWERAEPNFITGRLELQEYKAASSFSHSILYSAAASDLEVTGDFSLWVTHNARGHSIFTSSSPALMVGCSLTSSHSNTGEWRLYGGLSKFTFIYRCSDNTTRSVEYSVPSYDLTRDYSIRVTRVSGVLRMYLDNVLVDTETLAADSTPLTGTSPLTIGGYYDGHYLPNDYGSGAYHNVVLVRGSPASWSTIELSDIVEAECLESNLLTAGDLDVTELPDLVRGYRVGQLGAIRGALDPLRAAWPFDVVQHGYTLKFIRRGGGSVATIPQDDLAARPSGEAPGVQLTTSREMDLMLPRRVSVKFLEHAREYDIGEQAYERLNTDAVNEQVLDLPIVFTASDGAGVAQMSLYLRWLERHDASFVLPPTYTALEPSDVVTVITDDGEFPLRLTSVNTLPDGRLECMAKFAASALYTPTAEGEEGQSQGGTLTIGGPTNLVLLDVPLLRDADDTAGFPVAMAGYVSGWPGGILFRSDDNGQTWSDITGSTPPGSTIGYAINTLSAHAGGLLDKTGVLAVQLYSGELASVTEAQMFAGQNVFAYGAHGRWEIVGAQNAVLQMDGSYVLTDFARGLAGTEWATGLHQGGDSLVLMNADTVGFVSVNAVTINAERTYRGVTSGEPLSSAPDVPFTYAGVNLECLSPINLTGNRNPSNNNWTLLWTRRTRFAGWRDYVDAPLGEASEAYEVDIYDGPGFAIVKRTLSVVSPTAAYSSADQIADFGSNQSTLYVRIYQLSATVGRGYPLQATITR